MPYFGQERFLSAEARGPLSDELYQRAVEVNTNFKTGFAHLFQEQGLADSVNRLLRRTREIGANLIAG